MFPFTLHVPESTKRTIIAMAAESLGPVLAPVVEAIRADQAVTPDLVDLRVDRPIAPPR